MGQPTPTERLEELLGRHRNGDPTARESLLENSIDRLRTLARKMFRRHWDLKAFDQTDDVLSKALIRLYKALETVHPDNARGYYAIAAQHIRWVLGDLAREHRDAPVAYVGESPEPTAEGEPKSLQEWTEFHEVVEQLPAAERELFDLLVYQGLEQAEAAEMLGVPLRTFKRNWQRARLMFREKFGGQQ
jgi:RNA polymerase sigma-70 factor (ECF subfamily)